ncbi:MAG: aminoacyl-tRNA hydrolase [Patescibacteria group bacterium]
MELQKNQLNNIQLIVGLGNPGVKYHYNRHNLGFLLLDKYISIQNLKWRFSTKLNGDYVKANSHIYLKPHTYMNNSGSSVSKALSYFCLNPYELFVVHDDVDLPFGEVRVRFGSGAAGHNGVKDIFTHLGTQDFWRLRFGVGRSNHLNVPTDKHVLTDFTQNELDYISDIDFESYINKT